MQKVKISDFAEVITGGTPSTSAKEYWDNGTIPWLQSGACQNCIIKECDTFITEEGLKNSAAKMMKPESVLIALTGATTGKVGYLTFEACANQSVTGIQPNNKYLPKYLYYYLMGIRQKILDDSYGGAQKHISQGYVKNLEVPLGTIEEQRTIVNAIEKVDAVISARKNELQLFDDLVKARFVEMFGEPIANPMGWPVKRLKDLSVLITNGNTPKGGSENYVENGITFLRSQNVWRNRIELDDVAFIDEATHESMKKSSLHHDDILITKTGRINTENSSLGRAALFKGPDNSANINGHVYLVRLDGSIVPEFVLTILTGEAYRKYIRKVCVGGIDKRQINVDQVENFPIIVPPYEQQKAFAAFATHVDKSKFVVQQALDKAQLLFDNLMQHYFN